MKQVWLVLLAGVVAMAPKLSSAQVSVYGEVSGSAFNDPTASRTLYGGTAGILFGEAKILRYVQVGADLQGRIVSGSSESLKGVALGPRIGIPVSHGFVPYGEMLVGFGRYTSTSSNPNEAAPSGTTDAIFEVNGGLTKRFTPHLDAVAEFSYTELFALGGIYNPKTVSVGVLYHLKKR